MPRYYEDYFNVDQYGNVVKGPSHGQVKLSFAVEWINPSNIPRQFEGTEISIDIWNDVELVQGKTDIYSYQDKDLQTIYSDGRQFDDQDDISDTREITWHTIDDYKGKSHHIIMVEMCIVDWIMRNHPVALNHIMFNVDMVESNDYFYPYSRKYPERYITARIFDHWISCDDNDDIKLETVS